LFVVPFAPVGRALVAFVDPNRASEPFVFPFLEPPVARFRLRLAVPDMPLAALIVELIPSRRLFAAVLTFLGWLLTPGLLCEVPLLVGLVLPHVESPLRVSA